MAIRGHVWGTHLTYNNLYHRTLMMTPVGVVAKRETLLILARYEGCVIHARVLAQRTSPRNAPLMCTARICEELLSYPSVKEHGRGLRSALCAGLCFFHSGADARYGRLHGNLQRLLAPASADPGPSQDC